MLRKKVRDILAELYLNLEVEDACENVRDLELQGTASNYLVVAEAINEGCLTKESNIKLILDWLSLLQKERLVNGEDWAQAVAGFFEELPDIMMDAPLAPTVLARFLICALKGNVFTNWDCIPSLVRQALPADLREPVYGALASTLQEVCGLSGASELLRRSRMANAVFYFSPSQRTPKLVEEFLETHELQDLFPLAPFYAETSFLLNEPLAHTPESLLAAVKVHLSNDAHDHPLFPHELVQVGLESICHYMKTHRRPQGDEIEAKLWGLVAFLITNLVPQPLSTEAKNSLLMGTLDYLIDEYPHFGLAWSNPLQHCLRHLIDLQLVDRQSVAAWLPTVDPRVAEHPLVAEAKAFLSS